MAETDLILDSTRAPQYRDICDYINEEGRELWNSINDFLQQQYKAKPKIAYSSCSGKPGWNIKYQKSGKSLCTLYPEKDGFVALVVVPLSLVPLIEGNSSFGSEIQELVAKAKPFNKTLWLMIPVHNSAMLENTRDLIFLKTEKN